MCSSDLNQHASLEDLAIKLNKDLRLKFGTEARDWFDMMGTILPTYAKVKIASRDFDSRFRKPILALLRKYGVSETQFGRYVQALAAGTFNRQVKGLLAEARESVQQSIDSTQNTIKERKESLNAEGITDSTKKELKESIEQFEKLVEKKTKELDQYQESNYHRNGEFAPSGYTDKEAAAIVKSGRTDPRLARLLKIGRAHV